MKYILTAVIFVLGYMKIDAQVGDENSWTKYIEYKKPQHLFPQIVLDFVEKDTLALVSAFLEDELGLPKQSLHYNHFRTSPVGIHIAFDQYFRDIKVYRSGCKINISYSGKVLSIFDLTEDTRNWKISNQSPKPETVWIYDGNTPRLANFSQTNDFEYVHAPDGELLYSDDRNRYLHGKDTIVQQKLFNPDPLTRAHIFYGNDWRDFNDSNVSLLNQSRVSVPLHLMFSNDTLYFENAFAVITEISPQLGYSTWLHPPQLVDYGRGDNEFECLNILYHIYEWGTYVHSLGLKNIGNYQIPCDPHGRVDDQSMFTNWGNKRVLVFGDGGVDDAEDADVVIHEYNHYLLDDCSPSTFVGFERRSMDEASCDYFAASYSYSIDSFGGTFVYNWDGHNEFWTGRSVGTSKHYPNDINYASIHRTGEIWSGCMNDIRMKIGDSIINKLLYTSYFSSYMNMGMTQMARLVMQADSILYNYQHRTELCTLFNARGLLNDSCGIVPPAIPMRDTFSVSNQFDFMENSGPLIIQTDEAAHVALYSVDGKLIYEEDFQKGTFNFSPNEVFKTAISEKTGLASGFYVLRITSEHHDFKQMIMRIRN